jgi:hypothetical protein
VDSLENDPDPQGSAARSVAQINDQEFWLIGIGGR